MAYCDSSITDGDLQLSGCCVFKLMMGEISKNFEVLWKMRRGREVLEVIQLIALVQIDNLRLMAIEAEVLD